MKSYYETVAAEATAEKTREDARQRKCRRAREKHELILNADFDNIADLEEATDTLIEAEWRDGLSAEDYAAFSKKHAHIWAAERVRTSRMREAIKSVVAELESNHKIIHSRSWNRGEKKKLYADFYQQMHISDFNDKWCLNYATSAVNQLKCLDDIVIQWNEGEKAKALRNKLATDEKQRCSEQAAAAKQRATKANLMLQTEIFFARMETFVEGFVQAGVFRHGK